MRAARRKGERWKSNHPDRETEGRRVVGGIVDDDVVASMARLWHDRLMFRPCCSVVVAGGSLLGLVQNDHDDCHFPNLIIWLSALAIAAEVFTRTKPLRLAPTSVEAIAHNVRNVIGRLGAVEPDGPRVVVVMLDAG